MLVNEHDLLYKRSKPDKLRGLKKSFVEEVFGTYYLNSVLCLDCMRVSRTRDPTLDISLTISFKQQTLKNLKKIMGSGHSLSHNDKDGLGGNGERMEDEEEMQRGIRGSFVPR